jgi:hypothetical protein
MTAQHITHEMIDSGWREQVAEMAGTIAGLRALNAELLAALELMLNTYNWTGITSEAQRAARAAIAKARGQ